MGIKYLTVYAFSVENFNRSSDELDEFPDDRGRITALPSCDAGVYDWNLRARVAGVDAGHCMPTWPVVRPDCTRRN
jgi:undecaprenyl pyrophosphate synthase